MFGTSDPYQVIGGLAIGGLMLAGLWRLIVWVREAPTKPDPWDAEVEQHLSEPEAEEICPHCLTPQPSTAWFCKHCGKAVGPYNNLMPFVNVFSQGEVLRNGTSGRFRNRPLVLIGYILITLGINPFFAPIYWFFLLTNLKRPPSVPESTEEQNVQ
ncbi:MAG: zinc ribbon domain-containing protein [Verrucomicrobiia bacterium]